MIFVDTGAFVARYMESDQHHKAALKTWKRADVSGERLLTSNFVLDETFTLLGRWASYPFAAQKARLIYSSTRIEILRPDEKDELKALAFFEKFADQGVSFTDCVSFTLMNRYKARKAFSFDKHFERAGYGLF